MGLYQVPSSMYFLGFGMETIWANFHICGIMLVLRAVFNLLVRNAASNDTAYKRWSCHSGLKLLYKLCQNFPPQQWRPDLPFLGMPVMRTRWMAGATANKSGWCRHQSRSDNLKQTSLDLWYLPVKKISIRCNRIEHWVHLRCAGIRQAQYTDTWTCHLNRESRLTPHTDITPPHRVLIVKVTRSNCFLSYILYLVVKRSQCCQNILALLLWYLQSTCFLLRKFIISKWNFLFWKRVYQRNRLLI